MRLCTTCRIREPRNKTSSYCKECHNEYQKKYYKNNPRSISESNKKNRVIIRNIIQEHKNKPCMDCGIKYPYYVMDFDHVRGDKRFNLSVACSKYRSIKIVMEEISKCDLVCSNCHRIRTFTRIRE